MGKLSLNGRNESRNVIASEERMIERVREHFKNLQSDAVREANMNMIKFVNVNRSNNKCGDSVRLEELKIAVKALKGGKVNGVTNGILKF